jgi:hypothetical protein
MLSAYRASLPRFLALGCVVFSWPALAAEPQQRTCADIEEFLRSGKIVAQHDIPKGVTLPKRLTLEYNGVTHDAAVQTVNVSKAQFQTIHGTELNFKDYWAYDVAGYELAKILGLNMVPPYVERKVGGQSAAVSWWVPTMMMESERYEKKIPVPQDQMDSWNKQMYAVRVWHELLYDTDPNLTNLLITKDWQLWIIDFTRAFRLYKNLRQPKDLVQCDRRLLAKIRALDKNDLKEKLSKWLTKSEIDAVAARAVKITELFDKEVAAKGEGAVLYDFPRTEQACGAGL